MTAPRSQALLAGGEESVVRALARAVMRPSQRKVLLLDKLNRNDGWVGLDEAVRFGRAFSVRYRDDLLDLDADTVEEARAASRMTDELEALGHRPVEWASGGEGRVHVVVRIADGQERERWTARAKAAGIDVRVYSRPPLSPHRSGHPVRLLRPRTVEEAIEALGGSRAGAMEDPYSRISRRTWTRIRYGDAGAPSGSECVYRIALGLVAAGVGPEVGYSILLNPKHKGGEALRRRVERKEAAGKRWFFVYVWPKADEYIAANRPIRDPNEARIEIVRFRDEAQMYAWRAEKVVGPGGVPKMVSASSIRKCLEGICEISTTAGTIRPYIGERHLADVAGFGSRNTVRLAVSALVDLGWIEIERSGRGRSATTFRLLLGGTRRNDPQQHRRAGCT